MEPAISSVDGAWIGSYGFEDSRLPIQIEASFVVASDNRTLTGRLSDPGPVANVQVEGEQHGRKVSFTSYYVSQKTVERSAAVDYEGVMSEDGDSIVGTWKTRPNIGAAELGSWHVYRANSDRVVVEGAHWPPPASVMPGNPVKSEIAYVDAMTAKVFGEQMTLTKPRPSGGSEKSNKTAAGIAFAMSIIFLILAITTVLAMISRGTSAALDVGFATSLAASIILAFLVYYWYRTNNSIDAFVLDRSQDMLIKNGRKIALFTEIDHVEVKSTQPSGDTSTVTILLKDTRKIVVETGRTKSAVALSSDIGQFANVEVVAVI